MNEQEWEDEEDAGDSRVLRVAPGEGDVRLDKFLAGACPDRSRTRLQDLIDKGLVRRDGKPSRTR